MGASASPKIERCETLSCIRIIKTAYICTDDRFHNFYNKDTPSLVK